MRRTADIVLGFILGAASFVGLAALAGCTGQEWTIPLTPVQPVTPTPTPVPVDPVAPATPVDRTLVGQVRAGMTEAEVTALLGVAPYVRSARDDGTTGALWPTTFADGTAADLSVIFGTDGKSRPHALVPRGE